QPSQPSQTQPLRGTGAEDLLDSILGPETDVVVTRSREAANEDSGPKLAASEVATGSEPVPEPSVAPPPERVLPSPVLRTEAVSAEAAAAPKRAARPLGTPRNVRATGSGSVAADFDPQAREAALSTLRDVLDYRALRLDELRGRSMGGQAKARYAQLTTRLLVETHGLPSSRRFVRNPCHLPATLTQCDGALSRTLEIGLDDLGAGGSRLSMFDPSVRVGDEVWVAFDLAALFCFGQKVVFRSRVVWTSGSIGATGLMFGGNARFVDTVEAAIATG
ncbi:MAG: PilZ domain-containing protein, partial [Nannocystaceae bacterium]|nr:PilZ domain-containing protein [Nannocystaceae bacterium]